jgi:hypothetical protein
MLLRAARELREQGRLPAGARNGSVYRVRGTVKVVPENVPWIEAAKLDVYVADSAVA